jgi:hypothetical protein
MNTNITSWVEDLNLLGRLRIDLTGNYRTYNIDDLETFIKDLLSQSRQEIKKDLLKIADDGEYQDLRREVENYFK